MARQLMLDDTTISSVGVGFSMAAISSVGGSSLAVGDQIRQKSAALGILQWPQRIGCMTALE
eukprot:12569450-Ditylum_brightwellii.AAC.1